MSTDQLRQAREEVARSVPKDPAEELQSWTRTSRPEDARA